MELGTELEPAEEQQFSTASLHPQKHFWKTFNHSHVATLATLPMCFSITNTSQIPWNSKAAGSRWTKLSQALSRLMEPQSMAQGKAASDQMGQTRSIAGTSLAAQPDHCERFWKSSS